MFNFSVLSFAFLSFLDGVVLVLVLFKFSCQFFSKSERCFCTKYPVYLLQGLRELLEISQRNASLPKTKRVVTHAEQSVQTEPAAGNGCCDTSTSSCDSLTVEITLPMPPVAPPRTPKAAKASVARMGVEATPIGAGGLSALKTESSPEPG
jgi:hypothetical protein